jgi:hypothetical protein
MPNAELNCTPSFQTFGVEQAMKAKEEVEGKFKTIRDIKEAMTPTNAGQIYL